MKPIHIKINKDGKYEIGIQFFKLDQNTNLILKKFIDISGLQKESTMEEKE